MSTQQPREEARCPSHTPSPPAGSSRRSGFSRDPDFKSPSAFGGAFLRAQAMEGSGTVNALPEQQPSPQHPHPATGAEASQLSTPSLDGEAVPSSGNVFAVFNLPQLPQSATDASATHGPFLDSADAPDTMTASSIHSLDDDAERGPVEVTTVANRVKMTKAQVWERVAQLRGPEEAKRLREAANATVAKYRRQSQQ